MLLSSKDLTLQELIQVNLLLCSCPNSGERLKGERLELRLIN
jgi:hypothetical protein